MANDVKGFSSREFIYVATMGDKAESQRPPPQGDLLGGDISDNDGINDKEHETSNSGSVVTCLNLHHVRY